jgi:hypothetical protein
VTDRPIEFRHSPRPLSTGRPPLSRQREDIGNRVKPGVTNASQVRHKDIPDCSLTLPLKRRSRREQKTVV